MGIDGDDSQVVTVRQIEKMGKYEQFALAAALAIDGEGGTPSLDSIAEYIAARVPESTRESLRTATKTLLNDGVLGPKNKEDVEDDGSVDPTSDLAVLRQTWGAVIQFATQWTISLGGRLEGGELQFLNTPRVSIDYEGDDHEGKLGVAVTPTTITGMVWRRRLILRALRVCESQDPRRILADGGAGVEDGYGQLELWTGWKFVHRQAGTDLIGERGLRNALDAFAEDGLIERNSDGPQYRTKPAGRAALGVYTRCWWAVIPEERQPAPSTFAMRGGG